MNLIITFPNKKITTRTKPKGTFLSVLHWVYFCFVTQTGMRSTIHILRVTIADICSRRLLSINTLSNRLGWKVNHFCKKSITAPLSFDKKMLPRVFLWWTPLLIFNNVVQDIASTYNHLPQASWTLKFWEDQSDWTDLCLCWMPTFMFCFSAILFHSFQMMILT